MLTLFAEMAVLAPLVRLIGAVAHVPVVLAQLVLTMVIPAPNKGLSDSVYVPELAPLLLAVVVYTTS